MQTMRTNGRATVVQEKIRDGLLPHERPVKLYGGPGSGKVCVVCTDHINPPALQYECSMPTGTTLYFCRQCFFAWLHEVDLRS